MGRGELRGEKYASTSKSEIRREEGSSNGGGEKRAEGKESTIGTAAQRGWRFFIWPGGNAADEEQVGSEHPYATMLMHIEQQVAEKLSALGIEPLRDTDVCFAHDIIESGGLRDSIGGCQINVANRLQLIFHIHKQLREEMDLLIQTVCHEYTHGLFQRAFFQAHSADGVADFSPASIEILDKIQPGDVIASEALADAYAFALHNQVQFSPNSYEILPYKQLAVSEEYDQAYSMKKFLCTLIKDHPGYNFIYAALENRRNQPTWGLFKCLEQAIETDPVANSHGFKCEQLYERFRTQEQSV